MSRADLQHLSEGQVLTGVPLTRDEAATLSATRLVTATPEATGWRVAAGQWVGALRCGDLVVRVTPTVGAVRVLRLLARAAGVRDLRVDDAALGLAGDASLSGVLAVLLEREAADRLVAQPLRGYRTEEQTLPVVRGRLRLVDQELRRFGVVPPLEVTVDEWTTDTDENRRLRAAVQLLLRAPDVPARTLAGLRRVDRLLADVRLPALGSTLAPWRPTRLNAHLHPLLRLADLALAAASVEHRAGDVVARGFTVNMALLFERLVARLLDERCRAEGAHRLRVQERTYLADGQRLLMKPDLLVRDAAGPVAVADTKYKLLGDDGHFPNADAYQLLAYARRYGLAHAHLVYASGEPQPEPYELQGAGVTLHVHSFDLTATDRGLEDAAVLLLESLLARRTTGLTSAGHRAVAGGAR